MVVPEQVAGWQPLLHPPHPPQHPCHHSRYRLHHHHPTSFRLAGRWALLFHHCRPTATSARSASARSASGHEANTSAFREQIRFRKNMGLAEAYVKHSARSCSLWKDWMSSSLKYLIQKAYIDIRQSPWNCCCEGDRWHIIGF